MFTSRLPEKFIEDVKGACVGQEVLKSVSPAQQVIKIINDELVKLLGEGNSQLRDDRPLRVLMVGLHGAKNHNISQAGQAFGQRWTQTNAGCL